MKTKKKIETHYLVDNLRKIMVDRNITQAALAEYADTTPSQFSKIMSGQLHLSLLHVSNIARGLNLNEIDLFTYPEIYEKKDLSKDSSHEPIEATLQIKLRKDKKDQVLKLVFGEHNLEILNK